MINAPESVLTGRARSHVARRVAGAVAVALAVALGCSAAAPAQLAFGQLAFAPTAASAAPQVLPFPGTPDASPWTEIEFPTVRPSSLEAVVVRGSRSGSHTGHLVALVGGGSAFVPDHPFLDGERVSVTATVTGPAAGPTSTRPHGMRVSFQFGVEAPVGYSAAAARRAQTAVRHDIRDSDGFTHTFHSINWIHPPLVNRSGSDPDPSAGDIFADAQNTIQPGPMILDPQGNLIYFQPLGTQAAYDVRTQRYRGQQVLTYWQGYAGHYGVGEDMIYDHHYRLVATVRAGNGYQADEHEFYITPQGNAFITIYAPVRANLSSLGGPVNGTVLDSIIQEVNIATGQVLWEWHAYGHVHLAESYAGRPTSAPYDFFHINSIQPLPNGDLLVSARQTWTVYEINMRTGKIPYNIGGKHSSFRMGPGATFAWEHDAQMLPNGTLSVFDDGAGYYRSEPQSRALLLSLDYNSRQVSLIHAYTNNPPLLANSQGSVQLLGDGNVFVCFGRAPYFTEFAPSGRQLFSAWFPPPLQSYRGYRSDWWGQPLTPPSVAVSPSRTGTTVYASWNGATDVSYWRVLAGPRPTRLTAVGTFPKTFFETTIRVPSTAPYFAVQALGANGGVRATSDAVAR